MEAHGESGGVLLEFASVFYFICRSTQILSFLIRAVLAKPKAALVVALAVLAALAGTMTYTGFLVVGVLADYLGTGRFLAGLLLGVLFARFPWIIKGKLRVVGLLPRPLRRPLVAGLLILSLVHFLVRGDYVPVLFTGLTTAFVLGYPWLKKAVVDRVSAPFFPFTGRRRPVDDTVIEGEFREKKDETRLTKRP